MIKKFKRLLLKRKLKKIFSVVSLDHRYRETEKLLKRIEMIDVEAFDYLAIEFIKFTKNEESLIDDCARELIYWFIWDGTPQGFDYWDNISVKLGERS